ncbi:MAG: S8 family serine peptidase [Planctomycetota bacterium]
MFASPVRPADIPPPTDEQHSLFHSYDRYDFTYAGRPCIVVVPKTAAPGKPWVWRARFFGHEPQTDLALLAKGFHVAYIDVADLFGAPKAVAIWDRFHTFLTEEHGLSDKPALEGLSRGGLIVYNWAAKNPDKVACAYADAPVCDFKSWPGGKGKGKGSASDWAKCLEAYGMTEAEALIATCNPIDQLEPLAQANIPLLHVVGDADEVVPVAENTAILEQRYKALGGSIQVIHKPGIGHHPHSLKDPAPIVDFILAHAPREPEPIRERIEWADIWITNANTSDLPRVLMIGDSITRGYFSGVEKALEGKANCARLTTSRCVCDPVFFEELEMVLRQYPFRVIHFNNGLHGWGYTEAQYAQAFPRLLDCLRRHNPEAKLIWTTTTPVRKRSAVEQLDERTERVRKRNEIAMQFVGEIDLAVDDLFGLVIDHPEYFSSDGVHFNSEGKAAQVEQVARSILEQLTAQAEPDMITFARIDRAWKYAKGKGTKVAVLDWLFDMSPEASDKYVDPTSLVPGQKIGSGEAWHGEWMADIVHRIAPETKIMPIRARPPAKKGATLPDGRRVYENYLIQGIRLAADRGAVAVTNSMGPVKQCPELRAAIDYAESKGTIFIDVHPEYLQYTAERVKWCDPNNIDRRIIHTGVVAVPKYPAHTDPLRDIYVWPYQIEPQFRDGWGYSNGPPTVAGAIALMKSANPRLTPADVRAIITDTARLQDGFLTLDAQAAVQEALRRKK